MIIFEHGSLYNVEGELPPTPARSTSRTPAIRRPGKDVTLHRLRRQRCPRRSPRPRSSPRGASTPRSSTCASCARSTTTRSSRRSHARTARSSSTRAGAPGASPPRSAPASWRGAFYELDAPVARCAAPRCRSPTRKHLEEAALPSPTAIVAAARQEVGGRWLSSAMPVARRRHGGRHDPRVARGTGRHACTAATSSPLVDTEKGRDRHRDVRRRHRGGARRRARDNVRRPSATLARRCCAPAAHRPETVASRAGGRARPAPGPRTCRGATVAAAIRLAAGARVFAARPRACRRELAVDLAALRGTGMAAR